MIYNRNIKMETSHTPTNSLVCPLLTDMYQVIGTKFLSVLTIQSVYMLINIYHVFFWNVRFLFFLQISMAYGYWKNNRQEEHAVFDVFFRQGKKFLLLCIPSSRTKTLLHYYGYSQVGKTHLEESSLLLPVSMKFWIIWRPLGANSFLQ